uniref:Protein kinase domain-containing protein n=1 Tax=Fagus sylvatica TaxID=28930 RepID=A0A2N9HMS8_FAGSY
MKSLSNLTPIFFVFFTFHHICHFRTATSTESTARCASLHNITLINCGNSGVSTAWDGHNWTGDVNSEFCSFEESGKESNLSRSTGRGTSTDVVPYMTVRIFRFQFTYIFWVQPGQKFVRLHFNPVSYQGFDRSKAIFTVKSGSFTLLENFRPSLLNDSLGETTIVKEFCIIEENQTLNLTFTPRSSVYHAFINGIEIVSMPEDLYYRPEGQSPTPIYVGQSPQFYINYSMALEMVFRLNVGLVHNMPSLTIHFSKIPNYTAPDDVYWSARSMGLNQTKNLQSNLTWGLPVDLGFNYLVRPQCKRPWRKADYVVMIQAKGVDDGKKHILSIDLHPPVERYGSNYLLSRCCCWLRLNSYKGKNPRKKTFSLRKEQCHHFSLAEIKIATNNFHKDLIIGVGGFGNVYKGQIDDEETMSVAIKRLNPESRQGAHEFRTEIEMLSQLRHVHLVSLIGYSNDEGEMILVYDYMINGTLREHLYDTNNDPLPWKKRLNICIGAAHGLDYLHTGVKHTIIHRDVKTTNILLDEKWVAKVSDFGSYVPERHLIKNWKKNNGIWPIGLRKCIERGTINEIIDPYLKGKIAPKCFKVFVLIAESCTRDEGIQRPTMGDVVEKLKFALEVQENVDVENESMNPGGEYIYPSTLSFFIDATDDGPWATNEHGMTSDSGTVTGLTYSSFDMDGITTQQDITKNTTNI